MFLRNDGDSHKYFLDLKLVFRFHSVMENSSMQNET